MKKLASKLPIQQMIANVISNATEKLASDESSKKKIEKLVAYEKAEHGHIPTPAEEEAEHEKTASVGGDFIEKLASAVEYISQNLDSIEFPNKGVLQKAAEEAGSPQGAGKGPGSLEVTKTDTGGRQSYTLGKARNTEASSSKADAPLSGAREGDGKTQLQNDMHDAPGGGDVAPTARYPEKGPLVAGPTAKHASVQDFYRNAVLAKLAGEDVMKANISAERSANPLAGMGQLTTTTADQSSPAQAGDASGSGFGNGARRLIASNQAAIDATKGDAKGPVKSQLSEVLEEPALSSSTDPVLEENLRNTGKAGVKIAAVKASLEKVAQQGCSCETIDGECTYCRLATKVAAATKNKQGSTKVAMMGGMGGGMGGGMSAPPPPSPSMGGSSMTPMADAGAGADGCVCGDSGECRVCKLKAALAAAMMSDGKAPAGPASGPAASPVDNGPMGTSGQY